MKAIWRALSLLAQDPALCAELQPIAKSVDRTAELEIPPAVRAQLPAAVNAAIPPLGLQPDFAAVEQIRAKFRTLGVELSVYEGCEINRWLYEDRQLDGGGMKDVRKYWTGMDTFAETRKADPEFQALTGALAIDQRFRFNFAGNQANVSDIGFTLAPSDETTLRNLMVTDGTSDLAAQRFVARSWSGSCAAIARLYDGWVHFNG